MISKKHFRQTFTTLFPYIIAFILSMTAGLLVYHAKGIAPFGDQSVLSMDLWGQYFSMYVQNATAESFSDLLYSWNGAFGHNNWAQSAYYCNSIFLLLMRLVPVKHMVSALNWFCLLKIGFSSVACLALLQYKLRKRSPLLIAGAVSYSICAYMLAFLSQFMWTDSLIYAPLIIIGLERLMHEKKPLMYTITLAAAIISSFYIGFALCIFSVLYFAFNSILEFRIETGGEKKFRICGGKSFGLMIVRFGIFSLLAGGISAAVIIPTGLAITHTLASEAAAPEKLEWYGSVISVFQELLPGRQLSMGMTGVNIGTGIITFLLVPIYFLNKKIRIAERLSNLAFLAVLFISTNCNILDYIWHGFHFPNQLPGRWTFLISLMLVILGCSGLAKTDGITVPRAVLGALAGIAGALLVSDGAGDVQEYPIDRVSLGFLAAAAIAVIIYAVFNYISRKREASEDSGKNASAAAKEKISVKLLGIKKRLYPEQLFSILAATFIAAVQVWTSSTNFVAVSQLEVNGLPTSDGVGYTNNVVKMYELGTQWKNDSSTFYRTEANYGHTFNHSMIGDYHGMSHYSSTMNGDVFTLLRYLGNRVYADKVSSVYNITSPVQNGIFGVKLFLDTAHSLGYLVPDAELIEESEKCNIWENPHALPVAFAVSSDALEWELSDEIRALENQNTMLNSMYGEEINVFEKLEMTSVVYENLTLREHPDWNENYFFTDSGENEAKFYYTLVCEQESDIYIEHNFRAGKMTVSTSGGQREISPGAEPFAYLGKFAAGEQVSVEVVVENMLYGCCGLNMYSFNHDKWETVYNKLSQQKLNVTDYKSTHISGNITMWEDGTVFASIPQDGGWTVKCDGETLETELIGGALIAVNVPRGAHRLEFIYNVPGLRLGAIISVSALAITILICCIPKRKRKPAKDGKESA